MIRVLALTAAIALAPIVASAQPATQCSSEMAKLLMRGHQEVLIGTMPDSKLKLYASEAGTWTVVEARGNRECIVDFGIGWALPTRILVGTPA